MDANEGKGRPFRLMIYSPCLHSRTPTSNDKTRQRGSQRQFVGIRPTTGEKQGNCWCLLAKCAITMLVTLIPAGDAGTLLVAGHSGTVKT